MLFRVVFAVTVTAPGCGGGSEFRAGQVRLPKFIPFCSAVSAASVSAIVGQDVRPQDASPALGPGMGCDFVAVGSGPLRSAAVAGVVAFGSLTDFASSHARASNGHFEDGIAADRFVWLNTINDRTVAGGGIERGDAVYAVTLTTENAVEAKRIVVALLDLFAAEIPAQHGHAYVSVTIDPNHGRHG